MSELVDKIVEKYADDLIKWFPIQRIFAIFLSTLIFHVARKGEYLSAANSFFHTTLGLLADENGPIPAITLGTLSLAISCIFISNLAQRHYSEALNRFIVQGYGTQRLTTLLYEKSAQLNLHQEITSKIASEIGSRLKSRKSRLIHTSSSAELLFSLGISMAVSIIFGGNILDLIIGLFILLLWVGVRIMLMLQFIRKILPLEAHLAALDGIPYDLSI